MYILEYMLLCHAVTYILHANFRRLGSIFTYKSVTNKSQCSTKLLRRTYIQQKFNISHRRGEHLL